jgi:hypothetical protein
VNVSSTNSNLTSCRWQLLDANMTLLNTSTGCTSAGGYLSIYQNTLMNRTFYGKLSLSIGGTWYIADADFKWMIDSPANPNVTGTIKDFLINFKDLSEWGQSSSDAEFSRIVFIFTLLFIGMGMLSRLTGYDSRWPEASISLVCIIIWMLSIYGWFNMKDPTMTAALPTLGGKVLEGFNKYALAIITTLITGGYILNHYSRN